MEDVLEVYQRPYDPKRPQVCFDEASRQQTKETRLPLPVRPGDVATSMFESADARPSGLNRKGDRLGRSAQRSQLYCSLA
jgi:hypothetical protein